VVVRASGSARAWLSRPVQDLSGSIEIPGDKSISHRALLLGAVTRRPVTVTGFLDSADCRATRRALERLGVRIEACAADGALLVSGPGAGEFRSPVEPLDLGNSGTGIRLLTGLLAGQGVAATLTGDASLRARPMERVAGPLREMGALIATDDGCPPVVLTGTASLRPIDYVLPVASAQVKSAILLAALGVAGTTVVRQPAVTRDHTERMLEALGARIRFDDAHVVLDGPCELDGGAIHVPGDFSSAAFFVVAGLLRSEQGLLIRNVGVNPTRTGLLEILRAMGGKIEIRERRQSGAEPVADLFVRQSTLRGIDVPAELVPLAIDEFPVLFVAAAAACGVTRVRGAAELRVKESDRIGAMARALGAVGVVVNEVTDGMDIVGGAIHGGPVDSAGDHRIAMAMAIAGVVARQPIHVNDTTNVGTSFPGFRGLVCAIGCDLAEAEER